MNNIIDITIQGKPTAKQRSRKGGNHWYNPQRDIMDRTAYIISQQLPEGFSVLPATVPVQVDMLFFFSPAKSQKIIGIENENVPYLKKSDKDNLEKYVLDCMEGIIFKNDSQVFAGTTAKYYSKQPRTEISISW